MSIPAYKTILYATDMGKHMRPVFRHAISLAQHYEARLIMLHVAEPLGDTGMAALELYMPEKMDSFQDDELKDILAAMKKRLVAFYHDELGDKAGIVSKVAVVSGHPAEEIEKYAKKQEADLIVIGTHTKGGLASVFLGSTARKLIHVSDRPVLVVPWVK
ncbi:MAG: universal stress protein [Gammaproteobacteria bacterium]|nr:universal stress protein [Gammaproteobacteria bacterium]MBL7000950.1 universal stress protein [Gammaproteobacteria bacterium]